jgi:hypothetical protein
MTKILEYCKSSRSLILRNIDKSGFSVIAKEDIHIDEGDIKRIGNLFESAGIPFRIADSDVSAFRLSSSEIITLELSKKEAEKVMSLLVNERLKIIDGDLEGQGKEQIYEIIIGLDNIQKKIERGIAKSKSLG